MVLSGFWFGIHLLLVSMSAHDFHVSVTELDIHSQKREINVAMHIFIDDLEKGLVKMGAGDSLFLGTGFERADADEWIETYLMGHFTIRLDDTPAQFEWVGRELSDDLQAIWIYLTADLPPADDGILEITHDLLMEVYDDQKNLLNLRVDRQQISSLLFSGRKKYLRYELD